MNTWYNENGITIASLLAEDSGAPELRNPRNSAMRARSWTARLFRCER